MKVKIATLDNVAVAVVAFVLGVVLTGCGDSDSPTAPSAPAAAPDAPRRGPAAPPGPAARTATPASFDADGLRPDASGFNAYDFHASWDGSMLRLTLTEDEMQGMREASKPHRNRMITVLTCPVEPHHALQSCGDPIWNGSRVLGGRLELPPVPLASCAGWIVVHAAELSDDKYDGWRNAPCPASDGESVTGSDGTGAGWPEYPDPPKPEPEPTPEPAETVQGIVDTAIADAGSLAPGRGPVRVADVSDLFEGAEGTEGDDYRATSSDPTVATVEITSNPRVVVTPVGVGTATIQVTFLPSGAGVEFDVTVAEFLPLPLHELPFLRTDRVGDTTGSLDLTSFSIARPDASGWAAVTFTTAGAVDPTALAGFYFDISVTLEAQPSADEQWHMRISGAAWDFGYDSDHGEYDGNPYVRTSQSTAAASSFSFEIRLIPEIRNQVAWLRVQADRGDDPLPGDAVEAAGGEIFNGQPATPEVVFGASAFIEDAAYRVMIP